MTIDPTSRYRKLVPLGVIHRARGRTLSLPIRRDPSSFTTTRIGRAYRFTAFDSSDLLALRFYGREHLFWILLDANGRRLPDDFQPGEELLVPPPDGATKVDRK